MTTFPRYPAIPARLSGVLKASPADFVVEELPAYQPSGAGEHLFLRIEKTDLAAEMLNKHIAKTLGISTGDVGTAGLKDRRAITRQWVSVPAKKCPDPLALNTDRVQVLEHALHGNKLRTGHLVGNRFILGIRDLQATDGQDVAAVVAGWTAAIETIRRVGFANYYGDQRFGRDGETLDLGYRLIRGSATPRDIPYSRRKFLLKLALSSVQSDLFNQALAMRIATGMIETVVAGDVMEVLASGGKFVVEDATVEQPRFEAGETMLTGPMYGLKMKAPTGQPAEWEQRLLDQAELSTAAFGGFGDLLSGTRRPYLVRCADLNLQLEANQLRMEFTLPPGAYATTLVELFCETKPGGMAPTGQDAPPVENEEPAPPAE
jgi:tRNA pseudouridine13 synthase